MDATFTVYTSAGSAEQVSVVENTGSNSAEMPYYFTASVGIGTRWWVKRDTDQAQTMSRVMPYGADPSLLADLPARNAAVESSPPVGGYLHFRLDATDSVWNGGGTVVFGVNQSAAMTVNPTVKTGIVFDRANVARSVTYRDAWVSAPQTSTYTVLDNLGIPHGMGPDFLIYGNAAMDENWLYLRVPPSRVSHTLFTTEQHGGSFLSSELRTFKDVFTNDDVTVNEALFEFRLNGSSSVLFSGGYGLLDDTAGDQFTFQPNGYNNISFPERWYEKAAQVLLISRTRWSNLLQIRCADGTIYPIKKNAVHGDWTWVPGSGQTYFNSYGYFDATSTRQKDLPWHLYDATREEYLERDASGGDGSYINATDETDSDFDGLPDWYEAIIGTNPNNSDTDEDGVSDAEELALGRNPINPVTIEIYVP